MQLVWGVIPQRIWHSQNKSSTSSVMATNENTYIFFAYTGENVRSLTTEVVPVM